jgi:hypothetical protein
MSGKKKHRSANEALRYLRGEISGLERYHFEREMETDPWLKEAMEGLESLTPDEAEEDILALHARLRRRLARRRRIALYSAAATVASLMIIGTIFLQIHDFNPRQDDEAMTGEEIPFISEKSDQEEETGLAPAAPAAAAPAAAAPAAAAPAAAAPAAAAPAAAAEKAERPPARDATREEIVVVEAAGRTMAAKAAPAEEPAPVQEAAAIAGAEAETEAAVVAGAPAETEAAAITGAAAEAEAAPLPRAAPAQGQLAVAPEVARSKRTVAEKKFGKLVMGKVSGVVVSAEDMDPLPGALVVVKGGDTGVVADALGHFSLPAEEDATTTLVASFVGMEPLEYPVVEGAEVELVMKPDISSQDEVVMVGHADGSAYGTTGRQMIAITAADQTGGSFSAARPVAGYSAFGHYIEQNIRYPAEDSVIGRAAVVLQFTVTSEGKITGIRPLRSPGERFAEEAIRLINEGPAWVPATNASGATDEVVRLRILFKE